MFFCVDLWYNVENVCGMVIKMIIYFSKVNLATTELFDYYEKEEVRQKVRGSILSFMKNGVTYRTLDSRIDKDGHVKEIYTNYRLNIGLKQDGYISGVIYKETKILCKRVNEETQQIESHTVPTIEDVQFYYDVLHEIVGFHRRSRFGYQEFNHAFTQIINQCMENNKLDLRFEASLYNEGMDVHEISSELKKIDNIKKLMFNFKLPNPADDNMLLELKNNMTDLTKEMESANARGMSVIFDSDGSVGLNVDSEEIRRNINRVGIINKGISDKAATKNGYASVKAISKKGKIFTTEEHKPIKREISNEEGFFDACRETILGILSK